MPAEKKLRILHLEDDELDAELVSRAFSEQKIPVQVVRVSSREEFVNALESGEFDLIVSDYSMPNFDGLTALGLARKLKPEIPFVYISGTIGEERAVEALQQGATDYVLKDRLFRLGAVVRRSMKDSALRTQKQLVEAQLHATYVRLQQLLAASPAVLYSAPYPPGALASFVSENVRARFGYEPEDFTARADFWIHRIHPEDRMKVVERMRSISGAQPVALGYRFLHADGSYRWVEDRLNVVRDETGVPKEIVGSWVDVTDLRRMQEEVRRMEAQFHQAQKLEAIGSLAGGVAHDFNNILMIILSYGGFLLAKLPPDSPLRREVEEIRKAGNRAADLTHQLLAFSRKETLSPQSIRPGEAVKTLAKMLGRLIGDNIRLSLDLCEDTGFITCDPTQFDQILINLVVNARDAMPDGGEVTIQTSVLARDAAEGGSGTTGEYQVSVRDTGVGMSSETMSHIFDPFFTTKPAGKGTGLGLSMVYGAVRQNQGRIEVESEVGKGTTLRIYFQRMAADRPLAAVETQGAGASLGGLVTLLVEDNESVRQATALLLEGLGCSVIQASGGEQALQVFAQRAGGLDIVVTDVIMPDMSGPDLARRLRALRPDTRILFCTGYISEIELVERELGAGFPIIQKPFDAQAVAAKIRSILPAGQIAPPS